MSNIKPKLLKNLLKNDLATLHAYFEFSQQKINHFINLIDIINSDSSKTTKSKGDLLEELVCELFNSNEIFEIKRNIRTSTNEIDLVISLTILGKYLRSLNIIPNWIPDSFLIECKNYSKKIGVTYIGKFYSVIKLSNHNLGLFISTNGITGYNNNKLTWSNGAGLIKKITLKHSESANPIYIIPLDLKQIADSMVKSKGNILKTIEDIKLTIDLDIASNLNGFDIDNSVQTLLAKLQS